jgi:heterodisulfide reductase subunit C
VVKIGPNKNVRRDLEKVAKLSEQPVNLCMQCGTCSGSCPNVRQLDYSPRTIIHLAHLGLLDRLLASSMIWTCSSCLQCTATCPRGIDLARVMEAFRILKLQKREGRLSPAEVNLNPCADAPPILLISAMRKLTG